MAADKPYVIVVGVDYSDVSDLALRQAFEIGGRLAHCEVHVVHVASLQLPPLAAAGLEGTDTSAGVAGTNLTVEDTAAVLQRHVQERYNALQIDGVLRGSPARIVTHVRWEQPAQEIAQLASDLEADLLIVGTHGRRGLARILLGSVAEGLVRLAPCPVLVTRPKQLADTPKIEPPCPECIRTRQATNGEQLWCEQHRERHGHRHVYRSSHRTSTDGTMPLVFRTDPH